MAGRLRTMPGTLKNFLKRLDKARVAGAKSRFVPVSQILNSGS